MFGIIVIVCFAYTALACADAAGHLAFQRSVCGKTVCFAEPVHFAHEPVGTAGIGGGKWQRIKILLKAVGHILGAVCRTANDCADCGQVVPLKELLLRFAER